MTAETRTLIFTKGSRKTDAVEFRVGDSRVVKLENPKQAILPHDMIHAAVEMSFPFGGFISLVFQGHDPSRTMDVVHGIAPVLATEYPKSSWITESIVESIQATLWGGSPSFRDFYYLCERACDARKIAPHEFEEKIVETDFVVCMKLIGSWMRSWTELPVGESLSIPFRAKN